MKPIWRLSALVFALLLAVVAVAGAVDSPAPAEAGPDMLASPESFAGIADPQKRSAAYFTELGKVLTNPRCTNCHPVGDRPRQGDSKRLHQPPVFRGEDGFGLAAMRCSTCHQAGNFDPARMPGHAIWHLAPHEMAWEGKNRFRNLRTDQRSQSETATGPRTT